MPVHRAFFALPPGHDLRQALGTLAGTVATAVRGRATRGNSIHLTLAYVGDVANERLPALVTLGGGLSAAAFTLELSRLGCFRRARVAWIAPTTCPPALHALQRALADALAQHGLGAESRPFAPHVTLARHCAGGFDNLADHPTLRWPVEAFALWASASTPRGGRYVELARWPLVAKGA